MEERESRNTPGPLPRSSLWGEPQQGGFSHGEAWRAKLRGANLSGADLRGADLIEADLIGVDLSGAKLREANLHGTFLVAVKLDGADLSTAKGLSQPQINSARGDKDTKLPEEFQRPPRWLNEPQVG